MLYKWKGPSLLICLKKKVRKEKVDGARYIFSIFKKFALSFSLLSLIPLLHLQGFFVLSNFSLTIFLLLSRLSFLFLLFLFLQFFLSKLSSFNPSLFLLLCSFLSLFILNFHLFSFLFYLTYILPINLSSFS